MVGKLRNGVLVSALVLALPLAVAGQANADTPNTASAQKYVAEADGFLAKNDLKGALVALKNAKQADPSDAAIRVKLGGVELRLNDIDGAQIDLTAARDNGGDLLTIIPLLGRTYIIQGKFDQVLREFPVHDDAPTDIRVETLAVRANAQIGLNHFQDARASLTAAEQLKPTAGVLKFALARLDMHDNKLDSALKRVDDALALAPSADAHFLKAQILVQKNDVPGAMAEVDAALALEPNHVGALIERAQLYIAQGQDAKADADVKAVLKIAPQVVPARYFQALLLSRAQDYTGADNILTKYADGFKGFPQGYLLQAIVKLQLKQYEEAETAIDSYIAAVPADPRGRKFQAQILMGKGDFTQAADILQALTDERPDDAQAFAMLGEAYKSTSPQRSADAFAQAAKLAPDDPSTLRGLALDDLIGGQSTPGIADLEKVMKMTPDDAKAAEALAMAYIVKKQFADADKLIAEIIAKHPNDPVGANMAGLSAEAQSHIPDAKAAFQSVSKKFPDFIPARLELAKIYESEGDRDQSKAVFEAVLEKHPDNVPSLDGLSAILVLRGETGPLLEMWKKAYRAQPDNVAIDLGLIEAYVINKDTDGAFAAIRDMQLRQPKEPRLYQALAELQSRSGATKDAIETLRRLVELQPGNPGAVRDLALALEKSGDTDGALSSIAAARKLDPMSAILAADEVRILGLADPEKAIAAADRFAALLPDEPTAQAVEGDYLLSQKHPEEALAAYQRAMQAHPSLFLVQRISSLDLSVGRPLDGEKILGDWVAAHPQDITGRLALAAFLQSRKSYAAAQAQYESLLKDLPDDAGVMNNLAVIYQHDGDPRALDLARRAATMQPDNPQIADTLGWIMAQKDDVANGLKLLQRAHDMAPRDLDTDYHLAYALNQTGKKADAVALLKNALDSGADFESKGDAQALLSQLSKS